MHKYVCITCNHKDDPAAPWEFVSNSLPTTNEVIKEHEERINARV